MVDIPNQTGSMCDWPEVQLVDGAKDCLKQLSQNAPCHLATNAQDSSEAQIRQALERVGISDFITHIFCRSNLGVGKTEPSYYPKIVDRLGVSVSRVTMIGDNLGNDVLTPMAAGLKAVWFNPEQLKSKEDIPQIAQLSQLV